MKSFLSFCFLLAFVGLMLIGCSDKSISPVETTGVNDNSVVLQKETGPGAWIFRYESNLAFWFTDEEAGLVLTLGLNDPWTFCSDFEGESFSFKDIYLPNSDPDLRRILEQMKGKDITAKIWQVDPWPLVYNSFCTFFGPITPFEPMAVGIANFSYKDNDVLAWDQDNNNSNAFGYKANGTLVGQDGKVYKLNLIYNVIWDGDDFSKYKEVYKLQLTPTGK
jgi:hypothetical protein